jgi:hypothetical protein
MPPYNPNSIWTSKKNPNLPRTSRSAVKPSETASVPVEPVVPAQSASTEVNGAPSYHPAPRDSFFHRHGLMIFSISLAVIFCAVIIAVIFFHAPSAPATTLTVTPPTATAVGAPFVITMSSSNNSNVALVGTTLTLQLPDGMSFVGDDPSERAKEYALGDIAPGAVIAQSSTVIVTGNPSTLMALGAKLLYTTAQTPSTTYETDAATSFSAGPSVVDLNYSASANVVSGQSFPITVNYQNNSASPVSDAAIQMKYPPAFIFATSSIAVATGTNNTWNVGTLAPGQNGSFVITGTIVGPTQTQYPITGSVLTTISGEQYAINSQPVNFTLVASPLALTVNVNNSSTYVSKAGDSLDYTLTYTNNSNVTLASVNISANLIGQMYDFTSLQTNGSFNSKTNTITWVAANAPALTSVAPGQSGSVTFSIKTKDSFPIKSLHDKDYTLNVSGTIQSPTVLPNTSGTSTISVVTAQNKVGGAIAFAAKGYWQSGPYPPKVDQPTMYTINWAITNYSTDAKNITVSAYLQSGTSFIGAAANSTTASSSIPAPVYDPGTGLVTWTIPSIAAGTGIVNAPVSTSFTVSNTPAVNQVGNDITLLDATSLSATDAFTGGVFSATTNPITTSLPDDKSLGTGLRQVTQ